MAARLHRFDTFLTKDKSVSDAAQIPANAVAVEVYKQGAWAGETKTILASASGTLAVRHPGRLVAGETIQVGEDATATATVDSVDSLTQITVTAGLVDFAVTLNDRLRDMSNRPTTYIESGGNTQTPTSSQADSNALGHAFWYVDEESVDIRFSTDGSTFDFIYDHGGKPSNRHVSSEPDEAGAIAHEFDTKVTLANARTLLEVFNNTVSKFKILGDGSISGTGIIPTAAIQDDAVTAAKIADSAIDAAAKIVDGIITAAKLVAGGIVEVTSADGNTDYVITSSMAAIPGAAVTVATPAGTDSLFVIIGVIPYETVVANVVFVNAELFDSTGAAVLQSTRESTSGTIDKGTNIALVATQTGLSVSNTWQLRIQEDGATADGIVLSSSTDKKARLIVVEIKNHT